MSRGALLTDEVRAWIGRTAAYSAPEPLGRASIRYFALALGDRNPLHHDDAAARAAGHPAAIAPPTFVCETNQYARGEPDADGYLGHQWELPVPDCRALRGGHEYELLQPVTADDVLTVSWRVVDIVERPSRTTGSILVVTSEATYTNQHGELLARNTETLVFRPRS